MSLFSLRAEFEKLENVLKYFIFNIGVQKMKKLFMLAAILIFITNSAFAQDSLADLFPQGLVDAKKQTVSTDSLKDKFVGIYFSAQWCPPCRNFTPKLVSFRNANKDNFEVVFVSSDREESAKYKYMEDYDMAWPSMQWRSPAAEALKEKFEVSGIPSLIIISPSGRVITKNGRQDVENSPDGALATWKKAAE